MKHFLLSTIAFLVCFAVSGQDIKKVRNYYDKKDWAKGKEAVDLLLANEKEQKNWEAWYYKGLIYGQIAKDATLKGTVPDAWMISFEAYVKAMELDAKQTETYLALRSYPIFDNYLEFQREGNDLYNKQDYAGALAKYKAADKVGRFIYKNKWALSEIDTVLYFYAGAAAMQAELNDDCIFFFQKLADANITGEGYDICYRFLTYHYDKKGDEATSLKYAALGRKFYPADTYYDKLEIDKERKKNGAGPELFKKYESVIEKEPNDYDLRLDLASEMFNYLYTDQKAPADQKTAYYDKIVSHIKKCIEIDPKKHDAHLLLGKTYFNEAVVYQDELKTIKGTTPADQQKKTELKSKMEARMKEAIPNLETALGIFEKMSADELKDRHVKNEYKTTLYLLTDANRFLGNTEKEKFYDKKYQVLNQ